MKHRRITRRQFLRAAGAAAAIMLAPGGIARADTPAEIRRDGKFTGTSGDGSVTVSVTVMGGRMMQLKILPQAGTDPYKEAAYPGIPDLILARNTADGLEGPVAEAVRAALG